MDRSIFDKYLSEREARYRTILLLRIAKQYPENRWCQQRLHDLSSKFPKFKMDSIADLIQQCPSWDQSQNPIFSIPAKRLDRKCCLSDAIATVDLDWVLFLLGKFKYSPLEIRMAMTSINSEVSIQNAQVIDVLLNFDPQFHSGLEDIEIDISAKLHSLAYRMEVTRQPQIASILRAQVV